MAVPLELSDRDARRLALAAQALASPRPAARPRSSAGRLAALMARVGAIQLDAVSVLSRTQFLVPFSRIGSYAPSELLDLSTPGGPWWEYWGHEASVLPLETYPLFRHRMERSRADLVDSPSGRDRRREWRRDNAGYLSRLLSEIDDRGPLTASKLGDPRRRAGTWWDRRSDGRRALEMLFADGVLAAWRLPSFERVYDRADRVIPSRIRALPVPSPEDAERELVAIAATCLGVATAGDLAEYFRLRLSTTQIRIAELVDQGRLVEARVQSWRQPAYMVAGVRAAPLRRHHATLLSPFDSLIWTRGRVERLFRFSYRIEIYVPAARRRHGYYVLPLLVGDRITARLDLKADRTASRLFVVGAYLEPGADEQATAVAAACELWRMGEWLGLERVEVGGRGDLAHALAGATSRGR